MLKPLLAVVLATIIFSTFIPQSLGLNSLDRVLISSQRLVNAFGNPVFEHVNVNQQVQISADIANGQDKSQPFVYIVQIRDSDGIIISVTWITGLLNPVQSFSPAISWNPDASGEYTAEIFVWESLSNRDALSGMATIKIIVS